MNSFLFSCSSLEVVADPWLKDLYPALQNFLCIHPANQAPMTETVASKSQFKTSETTDKTDSAKESIEKLTISSNGDASATISNCNSAEVSSSQKENGSSSTSDQEAKTSQNGVAISLNGDGKNFESLESKGEDKSIVNVKAKEENSNKDISISISKDIQNIRAANRLQASSSFTNHEWQETPCEMLDKGSNPASGEGSGPSPLLSSQPPLCDQNLTVPVLPPPYLDISFCDSPVQVGQTMIMILILTMTIDYIIC